MAFDTVDERISALNIGTFGLVAGLYSPLQASGDITVEDAINALGGYVGVTLPGVGVPIEKIYFTSTVAKEISFTSIVGG